MPRSAPLSLVALLATGCLGVSVVGGPTIPSTDGAAADVTAADVARVDAAATDDVPDGGCPAGQVLCDGRCADLANDPAHCGGCAIACAAGQSCVLNICELLCPGAAVACDNHQCFDLQTDGANCGACGRSCAPDADCVAGACAAAAR